MGGTRHEVHMLNAIVDDKEVWRNLMALLPFICFCRHTEIVNVNSQIY
jgi:hypothetical protein